MLEDTLTVKIY